jgi:hypothetical protein
VDHTADWWLGDLTHPWFLELERAIYDEWGAEPMRVREGGVGTFLLPPLHSLKPLYHKSLYHVFRSSKKPLAVPHFTSRWAKARCVRYSLLHPND